MWVTSGFSLPKKSQKDLDMLSMLSRLYLLYKKGILDEPLKKEIYALYRSQLCDPSLQNLLISLMAYLHHPDDFITAFENPSLQGVGMNSLLWKWLEDASSSYYHLLHETEHPEEISFQLLLLILALTTARNAPCIENGFWKWSNPTGKDFSSIFPGFIANYFYWKSYKKPSLHWKNCQKMFEEFLEIFPEAFKKNPTYSPLFDALLSKLEQMKEAPSHWLSGPHGWPAPIGPDGLPGKWVEEMTEELLFYTSVDNGLVALCREVWSSASLYNYTKKLLSHFTSPLTLKKVEEILQTLDEMPEKCESKDPALLRLFSSLHSWKKRFLETSSFTIEFLDPKKETVFTAKVPETLEFALLHPEKVTVTIFSEEGKSSSSALPFLFTKKITFKGLLEPKKELEPLLFKLG